MRVVVVMANSSQQYWSRHGPVGYSTVLTGGPGLLRRDVFRQGGFAAVRAQAQAQAQAHRGGGGAVGCGRMRQGGTKKGCLHGGDGGEGERTGRVQQASIGLPEGHISAFQRSHISLPEVTDQPSRGHRSATAFQEITDPPQSRHRAATEPPQSRHRAATEPPQIRHISAFQKLTYPHLSPTTGRFSLEWLRDMPGKESSLLA
ncbi:osmiophilic body protein [Venturia nashicola]|uniref:Osmiophilic body protein n=1 Tax=Venturia nashicola TaxID=86259 RepID=A0A4Z1NTA4_9PEZI|nr:osmiophilic body protein [Venturia nashicola]